MEGKWTPEQVLQHDPKWLRELGLEIPPQKLWTAGGAGLLDAAVKIEGCYGRLHLPPGADDHQPPLRLLDPAAAFDPGAGPDHPRLPRPHARPTSCRGPASTPRSPIA